MRRLSFIFSLVSFLILAAVMIIFIVYNPSNFWNEVINVLLQLLVIGVFGSFISFSIDEVNRQRQQDQLLIEYRRTMLKDLIDAYNSIKRARRMLRSNGFYPESPTVNEISMLPQSDYKEQLDQIVDVQLRLEAIGTEAEAFKYKFTEPERLSNIRKMDDYLHTLVVEFEDRFINGVSINLEIKNFSALSDFLSKNYATSKFKTEFIEPYKSVLKSVQRDIFDLK